MGATIAMMTGMRISSKTPTENEEEIYPHKHHLDSQPTEFLGVFLK